MKKLIWDRLGIALSSACAIHCFVVAFMPLLIPVSGELFHASWIHIVVTSIILFTSPLAFVPGLRKHGLTWIIITGIMGLMLVFMSILLENRVSDQVSHGISICGSFFLVFAHFKNLQHTRLRSRNAHQHHCC